MHPECGSESNNRPREILGPTAQHKAWRIFELCSTLSRNKSQRLNQRELITPRWHNNPCRKLNTVAALAQRGPSECARARVKQQDPVRAHNCALSAPRSERIATGTPFRVYTRERREEKLVEISFVIVPRRLATSTG